MYFCMCVYVTVHLPGSHWQSLAFTALFLKPDLLLCTWVIESSLVSGVCVHLRVSVSVVQLNAIK